MGLIKAAFGSANGNLADQWKEMIYCDTLDVDTLVTKGHKRTNSRTSNTKGDDNIISNGSVVVVNNGQCMVIVEQGKVVDFCAEPGEFTYDSTTSPSLFTGKLGESIGQTFSNIGKRFTFGGDTGVDQRVYYVNTKEILGNRYGTTSPVPFRVVDTNIGLDIDISVRCHGDYSYRIVDPLLFYTNVCGNVSTTYQRQSLDSQLKSELLTALQPAFARISDAGVRYSAIPAHTTEVADALRELLSEKWTKLRGIQIVSFGVNAIAADEEDRDLIKNLQKSAVMRDPSMAAAVLTGAQADAMVDAANNEGSGGAFMAFAGMNMAVNAGGTRASDLFQMSAQQNAQAAQQAVPAQNAAGGWTCPACGTNNSGKFCVECGTPQPKGGSSEWACPSCGTENKGKFCMECGTKQPNAPKYKCDKCGWTPEDQTKPPKFCPECGDPFNDEDIVE